MKAAPIMNLPVKLRHGISGVSARTVQIVTAIKKLSLEDDECVGLQTQADIDGEGGYWIKTDYTKGEWWAWILFRIT